MHPDTFTALFQCHQSLQIHWEITKTNSNNKQSIFLANTLVAIVLLFGELGKGYKHGDIYR
jgi:hypothetical protein